MTLKPFKLLTVLSAGLALFFSLGVGHALLGATAMSSLGIDQMGSGECQSTCNLQSQPVAIRPVSGINKQDIDPQPTEPYYLAFMSAGWTTIATVAAAYLFRYLRWRPPDFIKLYAVYRF